MKIEMKCGGEVDTEGLEEEAESVVCSKGCTHTIQEVDEATPVIVELKCGGTVDLKAVPKGAETATCSKGCSHTLEEIALRGAGEAVVGVRSATAMVYA